MTDWNKKFDAYLHDPPEKVLDLAWHKKRAENYEAGLGLEDSEFHRECDHTAAAADRLPWPRWQFLESAFDGQANFFKHPLGGTTAEAKPAGFRIRPYASADLAHDRAWDQRPRLNHGDDCAQFFAFWRFFRWWASDQRDSRLAFLPADTRLPDHTIWSHNSIVSALQACVTGEGKDARCRSAFLLFQIGPVQDYIAQARRTLDLWSGSYLVSYLIGCGLRHIALNYGPDNVIFPNLCGQPIFDLLQPRRRCVDLVAVATQQEGQVFELRLDTVAGLEVRRKPRVDGRQLADPLPDMAQRRERRRFVVVEFRVTLSAQPLDRVGAPQELPLGAERLVLAGDEAGLLQLSQLELDKVEARGPFTVVHPQPIELFAQAANGRERRGDLCPRLIETGPRIEQREMLGRIEQLLVLVLPVQLDEPVRQVLERGRGGQRAVDERAAPAL